MRSPDLWLDEWSGQTEERWKITSWMELLEKRLDQIWEQTQSRMDPSGLTMGTAGDEHGLLDGTMIPESSSLATSSLTPLAFTAEIAYGVDLIGLCSPISIS